MLCGYFAEMELPTYLLLIIFLPTCMNGNNYGYACKNIAKHQKKEEIQEIDRFSFSLQRDLYCHSKEVTQAPTNCRLIPAVLTPAKLLEDLLCKSLGMLFVDVSSMFPLEKIGLCVRLSTISALALKLTNYFYSDMEPRVMCVRAHDLSQGFDLMNCSI